MQQTPQAVNRQGQGRSDMTGKRVSAQQTRVMAVFTAQPESWFDRVAIEHRTGLPGSKVRHLLPNFSSLGLLEHGENNNRDVIAAEALGSALTSMNDTTTVKGEGYRALVNATHAVSQFALGAMATDNMLEAA
jgi:hypothetical protein